MKSLFVESLRILWAMFLVANTAWVVAILMPCFKLSLIYGADCLMSSTVVIHVCAMLGLLGLWILLLNNNFSSPYIRILTVILLVIGVVTATSLVVMFFSLGLAFGAPIILLSLWLSALIIGAMYGVCKKIFVKK